jgi:hypothetical protein
MSRHHLRLVKPDDSGPSLDVLRGYKQVYLAGPYTGHESGDLDQAYHEINLLLLRLRAQKLFNLYSPIAHWHGAAIAGDLPTTHDVWKDDNEQKVAISNALLVAELPGWKSSHGVNWEIQLARHLQRPVYFINPETLSIRQ